MKKEVEIDARDRRMLELLSSGAASKVIAKKLGYRDGTMRVYLHDLYRKIGVDNKTAAVVWYFDRNRERAASVAPAPVASAAPSVAPAVEECFGDIALRENLHFALGAMNMFLGPYGRTWEVASRLRGAAIDAATEARRRQARGLWESLLRGDFTHAKALHEQGVAGQLAIDSPSEALLLAASLICGGYTRAADQMTSGLTRRRKGEPGLPESERTFILALHDAMDGDVQALGGLHAMATEKSTPPVLRQLAIASMFHVYRSRKDAMQARDAANALCALAEDSRQHLQAMGERPLYRHAELQRPAQSTPKGVAAYIKKLGGARLATVEE